MRRLKIFVITIAMVLAGCFSLLPVNTYALEEATPTAILKINSGESEITYYIDSTDTLVDTDIAKYYLNQDALIKGVFGYHKINDPGVGILVDKDVVTLLSNVSYTGDEYIKITKNITLDLNDKTFNVDNTFIKQILFETGSGTEKTIIKNGTISGMTILEFKENMKVELDKVTINSAAGTYNFKANKVSSLVIKDSTFDRASGYNANISGKTVTITNSKFVNNTASYANVNFAAAYSADGKSTVTITDSTFENNSLKNNLQFNNDAFINASISGSYFNGTSKNFEEFNTIVFRNSYFTLTNDSPFYAGWSTDTDYSKTLDIDDCYLVTIFRNNQDKRYDVPSILLQSNSFVDDNKGANKETYPYIIKKDTRVAGNLAYVADLDNYYPTVLEAITAAKGSEVSILTDTTLTDLNCNINGMRNTITIAKTIDQALTSTTNIRNATIKFSTGQIDDAVIKNGKIVSGKYSEELESIIVSFMDSNSLISGTESGNVIKPTSQFSVKIGNVGYSGLLSAMNAASENDNASTQVNDSIVLLKNITNQGNGQIFTEYATFTIDLNGYKYSNDTFNNGLIIDGNYANVTIKDSSTSKTGSISAKVFAIVTNGISKGINLSLDGITIDSKQIGVYFPSGDGSTLTIKDSKITGAITGIALKGGTTTITNTTINAKGAKSTPTSPLTGGVNTTGDAIYIEGNYNREIILNITSGTFISDKADAIRVLFDTNNAKISITGGEFSSDVSSYIPSKYTCVKNGDLYTVGYEAVVKQDLPRGVEISKESQETLKEQSPIIINSILESNTVSDDIKKQIQTAISDGKEINIVPVVKEIKPSDIGADVNKVNAIIDQNDNVLKYIDIKITLQIDGKEITNIAELAKSIDFYIELDPSDIQVGREYFIIHIHNGVATRYEATLDGNRLVFKADKFSTFAVGYKEKASPKITTTSNGVQTDDAADMFPYTTLFMCSGIAILYGIAQYRKTREEL